MKVQARPARRRRIRLVVVDDHEVVRIGLIGLLNRTGRIEVVGEAGSVAQAVAEARRLKPDLVLMDLRLSDGSGLEACREILSTQPETRVLFLTSYSDDEAVAATLLARASGYLLKDIGREALIRAIEAVADGQSILDPRVTKSVIDRVRSLLEAPAARRKDDLSQQEARVLALVVEGKTNKEIARDLDLSAKTVKNYLSNAFQKLHVGRRSQAAAIFSRRSNGKPE